MPEFFLELFSEEIPARMQRDAAAQLEKICTAALQTLGIHSTKTFYGPRRIALSAVVNAETSAKTIEERGPRETAPEAALNGFLGKHGATRDDVVVEGGYFLLRRSVASVPAATFVLQELPDALAKFSWPKSMRWGQSGDFTWVRPLRRIVCLLDGEVVPVSFGPLVASNISQGHRFVAPEPISVSSSTDWQAKLRNNFIIADQDERREKIINDLKLKASLLDLTCPYESELIDEVNGLVEWPNILIGTIDDMFMSLPFEVRELSMKVNQRYFALRDKSGRPAARFAFVSNMPVGEDQIAIVRGNERVLRARLSDARHFWNIDLKTSLDQNLAKLDKITFHAKIGSQLQRANRIAKIAREISEILGANEFEADQAEWAGRLCKADLVTGMVGEFPELQGVMGGYYAALNPQGWEGQIVAEAISEHYLPKGPNDRVPTNMVSASVALADKLDTLVEFFRIGEKPSGSGDPYALRRAALGVIRIIIENDVTIQLKKVFEFQGFEDNDELYDFILDRLRVKMRSDGQRYDILDATLAARNNDNLLSIMRRTNAITRFLQMKEGLSLLTAYRRAANILRIEDAKDGPHTAHLAYGSMETPEEEEFRDYLKVVEAEAISDFEFGNFSGALTSLSKLSSVVEKFFEAVKVNVEWQATRSKRLGLLAHFRDTVNQIADFSKIVG